MNDHNRSLEIGAWNRPGGALVPSFSKPAKWIEAAAGLIAALLAALSLWLVATGRISYDTTAGDSDDLALAWLDTGVRVGAVSFAIAAGRWHRRIAGPVLTVVSPMVFAAGAVYGLLPAFPDTRCMYGSGVCGEPLTALLVGSYLVATVMLVAGVLLACAPRATLLEGPPNRTRVLERDVAIESHGREETETGPEQTDEVRRDTPASIGGTAWAARRQCGIEAHHRTGLADAIGGTGITEEHYQASLEQHLANLLQRRRRRAITEAEYQTELLEVRRLMRQRAEGTTEDIEHEAAESSRPLR